MTVFNYIGTVQCGSRVQQADLGKLAWMNWWITISRISSEEIWQP